MNVALHVMLVAILLVIIALGVAVRRARHPKVAVQTVVGGLLSLNGLGAAASLAIVLLLLSQPLPVLAQEAMPSAVDASGIALGAALATGLACIGAGIAVGIAGAAAIGGITEKPEILGRTLIFVGLAEGIAIYGLIISFMILNR